MCTVDILCALLIKSLVPMYSLQTGMSVTDVESKGAVRSCQQLKTTDFYPQLFECY